MENNTIIQQVTDHLGADLLSVDESYGMISFTVDSKSVIPFIQYLRDQQGFGFLTDLCGIHYPDRPLAFGVIYHMHNMKENTRVRIETFLSKDNPKIDTATTLFPAANWMERETFDFYGIIFEGHPNLKRILNVEYMDYHPMRKEYPLEDPTRHDKEDSFFGR